MSKPALGKNLGQLLNGDAVGGKPLSGKVVSGVQFGRGMDTLVGKPQPEPIASPKKDLLPAWFYFGADLLILAFVAALVFGSPKPIGGVELLFCLGSTLMASLFGLAGVARSAG